MNRIHSYSKFERRGISMNHYKSWSGLNKQLRGLLCKELKDRISYFLTRYHDVHNAYGRAAVCLDGRELTCFSWIEMYRQEEDVNLQWKATGEWDYDSKELKEKWDLNKTYYEMDFLSAALEFLQMPIEEALESDNYIIKMFAIMDRRVGKRRLKDICASSGYESYPEWVRQFYEIRIS